MHLTRGPQDSPSTLAKTVTVVENNQLIGLVLLTTGVVDLLIAPIVARQIPDPGKRPIILGAMFSSALIVGGLGLAFWQGYL